MYQENITSITELILSNGDDVDSLEQLDGVAVVWMGMMNTVLMFSVLKMFLKVPGHEENGYSPVYIPEHYSERTSQHLLDPYSYAHISHGAIGFIFTFLTGLDPGFGFLITVLSAVLWEFGENTDYIINIFRQNSGPSEQYKGDSQINSFGDVISCSIGYSLSYIISRYVGGSYLPALLYIVIAETVMAYKYRDNMFLLGYQIVMNDPYIKIWQLEIIPMKYRKIGRSGYLTQTMSEKRISTLYTEDHNTNDESLHW